MSSGVSSLQALWTDEFVASLCQQDERAFGRLYDLYADVLLRYVCQTYNLDTTAAQDIVADTFVKIRQNVASLTSHDHVQGWIRSICRNTAIDTFKKKNARLFSDISSRRSRGDSQREWEFDIADDEPTAADSVEIMMTYEQIETMMDTIGSAYKDVLYFRYALGYEYREIATICGESESVVRQRCSRAIRKLRALCDETT